MFFCEKHLDVTVMQGARREQGKRDMDSDFERHVPCGDPFVLFCFVKEEQNQNSWMANKGYVQIFRKAN